MKTFSQALAIAGLLILTLGTTTLAADNSGNGATIIDVDTCAPLVGGSGTVCVQTKGMLHEVVTPSGNASYVSNYREAIQVIDDGGEVVYAETSSERFHSLTKDDVLREMSWRGRFTITSFGSTYCVLYHFHGTNGEDQFARVDFCS